MADRPRILLVRSGRDGDLPGIGELREACEVVEVRSPLRALARLTKEEFAGVLVESSHFDETLRLGRLLQNERILRSLPDGVVLLDSDNIILWANERIDNWCKCDTPLGKHFYTALGSPEILGPDFAPFHTALASGQTSCSTLRTDQHSYLQVHAVPLIEGDSPPQHLIVTVHDTTEEVLQQQKLEAIHKAGIELADLTTQEIFDMEIDERIELLKSNILHYTKDLLNFDRFEIRLLEQETGLLSPLLHVGMDTAAVDRGLFARAQGNGVTGFVAATGKSYLCEDTTEDPIYITGFKGAMSSLTVPLILHDEVIGTFNVESPEPRAFSESDLQFLEIFSRDVAVALNTLELLVAQKANAALASAEAIHRAVALPVDEILNDAVNVMERYIGHEPEVVERLKCILRRARDIKQVIQSVGQEMAPSEAALPYAAELDEHGKLRGRRILVADDDQSVRDSAHALLERYGCIVETAHAGGEAVFMVRNSSPSYDVIIADVKLPDMGGYELLVQLKGLIDPVPLILMSGFGYDPGHSIVKARQAGLPQAAVLYKPFRLDQLLSTVREVLDTIGDVHHVK